MRLFWTFYRWGNWGVDWLSNFSKFWTWKVKSLWSISKSCVFPVLHLPTWVGRHLRETSLYRFKKLGLRGAGTIKVCPSYKPRDKGAVTSGPVEGSFPAPGRSEGCRRANSALWAWYRLIPYPSRRFWLSWPDLWNPCWMDGLEFGLKTISLNICF